MTDNICKAKTRGGTRCKAKPLTGSSYCFVHDPALAVRRTEWRRKGGSRSKRRERREQATALQTSQEIRRFLGRIIEDVQAGEVAPSEANAIARLCNLQLRAIGQSQFEERLDSMEQVLVGEREHAGR